MPYPCKKQSSPRHGFVFDAVPTKSMGYYLTAAVPHPAAEYGLILDSVFEMADAIATSNGTPPASAVEQVIEAEGWRLLPRHKRAIVNALQS